MLVRSVAALVLATAAGATAEPLRSVAFVEYDPANPHDLNRSYACLVDLAAGSASSLPRVADCERVPLAKICGTTASGGIPANCPILPGASRPPTQAEAAEFASALLEDWAGHLPKANYALSRMAVGGRAGYEANIQPTAPRRSPSVGAWNAADPSAREVLPTALLAEDPQQPDPRYGNTAWRSPYAQPAEWNARMASGTLDGIYAAARNRLATPEIPAPPAALVEGAARDDVAGCRDAALAALRADLEYHVLRASGAASAVRPPPPPNCADDPGPPGAVLPPPPQRTFTAIDCQGGTHTAPTQWEATQAARSVDCEVEERQVFTSWDCAGDPHVGPTQEAADRAADAVSCEEEEEQRTYTATDCRGDTHTAWSQWAANRAARAVVCEEEDQRTFTATDCRGDTHEGSTQAEADALAAAVRCSTTTPQPPPTNIEQPPANVKRPSTIQPSRTKYTAEACNGTEFASWNSQSEADALAGRIYCAEDCEGTVHAALSQEWADQKAAAVTCVLPPPPTDPDPPPPPTATDCEGNTHEGATQAEADAKAAVVKCDPFTATACDFTEYEGSTQAEADAKAAAIKCPPKTPTTYTAEACDGSVHTSRTSQIVADALAASVHCDHVSDEVRDGSCDSGLSPEECEEQDPGSYHPGRDDYGAGLP